MAIKLGVLQEQAIAVLYWMRHEVRSEVEKIQAVTLTLRRM